MSLNDEQQLTVGRLCDLARSKGGEVRTYLSHVPGKAVVRLKVAAYWAEVVWVNPGAVRDWYDQPPGKYVPKSEHAQLGGSLLWGDEPDPLSSPHLAALKKDQAEAEELIEKLCPPRRVERNPYPDRQPRNQHLIQLFGMEAA